MPSLHNQIHRTAGYPSKPARLLLLVLLAALLALCWRWGSAARYDRAAAVPIAEETVQADFSYLALSEADRNTDAAQAQRVRLDDAPGVFTVTSGGDYLLSGALDGTIRVDAHDEIVHLFLDGVRVTAHGGPALIVEDADRVIVTLMPDTDNSLSDSGDYRDAGDADACVYSACDLVFNGTGRLSITGLHQDAVHCKDALKIVDGTYRVESKRSGLRGNDGVHIAGGECFIGSEKYGLRTTKQGEDGRGDILVHDCTLRIVAGRYAFVADRADAYLYSAEVLTNSVIDDFSVQGRTVVEGGCMQ